MFERLTKTPLIAHAAATAAAFALFQFAKGALDASYAASGYPVDYATGQLSFSAAKLQGYYAVMGQAGTLGIYVRTQVIDFGFIASVMVLSLLLGPLVARLGARWIGFAAAIAGIAGASFDVIENLLSFVLLADPQNLSQGVALAYSTAAAIKFALLTTAMATVLLALIAGLATRLRLRTA